MINSRETLLFLVPLPTTRDAKRPRAVKPPTKNSSHQHRRTLIKGDHIIGVKQRFPVAWAAPKRSWLTEPMKPAASS